MLDRMVITSRAALLALAVTSVACGPTSPPPPDAGEPPAELDGGADAGVDAGVACPGLCSGDTPVCDLATGECVGCLKDADCPAEHPTCDLDLRACIGCASDEDCGGQTPVCDLGVPGGACVGCLEDADCEGDATRPFCAASSQSCVSEGDACIAPIPVAVAARSSAVVQVDTRDLQNDTTSSCGDAAAEGNQEAAFRLTLDEVQDLTVLAQGGDGVDPVLYLRSAACADGAELACADDAGSLERLDAPALAPGTWFLFVETYRGQAGAVEVTVTLSDPVGPPANDTCAAPEVIALPGEVAVAQADLRQATDDLQAACNPIPNSPEVVFQLDLAQSVPVVLTARGTPGVRPVLYLSDGTCQSPPETAACAVASGTEVSLAPGSLGPGTYFVVVEADPRGAAGLVDLTVELLTNDTCANPRQLQVTPGATTRFQVSTQGVNDDEEGSCYSYTGAELVYQFTLAQPQDVRIRSTPAPGSSADPILYLRQGACSPGVEVACAEEASDGAAELTRKSLPPGDYFLFVETYSSYPGALDLEVELSDPTPLPPGDRCDDPLPITFAQGATTSTFRVDTSDAEHDYLSSCGSSSSGRDKVLKLTLTQPWDVTVAAQDPNGLGLWPRIWLGDGACGAGQELACDYDSSAELFVKNLAPGDYFLFLGDYYDPGEYEVTVTLSGPTVPPPGDTCAMPASLGLPPNGSTSFQVDTTNAGNEHYPTCNEFSTVGYHAEVVYELTLTQAQDIHVQVSAAQGSMAEPIISARKGACTGTAATEVGCLDTYFGPNTLVVEAAGPGTYWIFIESYGSVPGLMDVNVSLLPPTLVPAETCLSPQPITFSGTSQITSFTVDTADFENDVAGSCNFDSGPGYDKEAVFALTLSQTQTVSVTAGGDATVDTVLYVRDSPCDTGAELACRDQAFEGGIEAVTLNGLPAGTYYVFIETWSDWEGPVDVTVQLSP